MENKMIAEQVAERDALYANPQPEWIALRAQQEAERDDLNAKQAPGQSQGQAK